MPSIFSTVIHVHTQNLSHIYKGLRTGSLPLTIADGMDGSIEITWFEGSASDFIDASAKTLAQACRGGVSTHGASVVRNVVPGQDDARREGRLAAVSCRGNGTGRACRLSAAKGLRFGKRRSIGPFEIKDLDRTDRDFKPSADWCLNSRPTWAARTSSRASSSDGMPPPSSLP
jgi:hypothetical protein